MVVVVASDCCHVVMAALRILPPFLVLSLCYCLWFVFMRFFNDLYRVNAWGFNATFSRSAAAASDST